MKEKNVFKKLNGSGLFTFLLLMLCSLFGVVDGSVLAAAAIMPPDGGAIDTAATVTAGETRVNSPNLQLDTLDEKVAKVRPYDVIVDTIARNIPDIKTSDSQIVRHYAIDVIDLTATLTTAITYAAGTKQAALVTSNDAIFASEQTIFCMGVSGYLPDGATVDPQRNLMLYVVGKDAAGHPLVTAVNGRGSDGRDIPSVAVSTVLLRGGRAGAETQIQTDAYSGVPTDFPQYLQKFMAQIEMSDIFERIEKEVDWNFNDLEEEAVFDMKRTQDSTFLLGVRRRLTVKNAHTSKAEDVYFTEGIWTQAGKDFSFGGVNPTAQTIVTLMKTAFTGNASGKRKLFIVGSDLLEAIEKIDYNRVVYVGAKQQAFGLEFSTIISKFGTLLSVHCPSLDEKNMGGKGLILDPDFLRKWTMGWRVNDFDFRKSGQADADGRGLMEICGLVLKNPKAHTRVSLS
jgi:hypothetical protein